MKKTILIISVMFLLIGIASSYVWNTQYTYDDLADGKLNQTLWLNTSYSGVQSLTEPGSTISGTCGVGGGSAVTEIYSKALPPLNAIKNLTVKITGAQSCPFSYNAGSSGYNIFGTFGRTCASNNGACGGDHTYTLIRNYTGTNKFDVYNETNSYLEQIIGSTNDIYAFTGSFTEAGCSGSFTIYPITYNLYNGSMNVTLNTPFNSTISKYSSLHPVVFNITSNTTINNLKNITLYLDGVDSNYTTITGLQNQTIFSNNVTDGTYTWYARVCDDSDNCKDSNTRTLEVLPFDINSNTYNATTYETSQERFILNVSNMASATLVYSGTSYVATKSGDIYTRTLQIPTSTGSKDFYWDIVNSSGIHYYSATYTQTVNPISFGYCNSTLIVPYMNFTFLDESTGLSMSASNDLSTWSYWFGDGTYKKSYSYTNTSTNPSYAFCFSPPDRNMNTLLQYFQYSNTTYPQRQYYFSGVLSNTTTNKVLYLLSSSAGIYSTFITTTSANTVISGVSLTIEREISGTWTTIASGVSDSAGSVTVWLNPNFEHRLTATKIGYGTTIVTLRPTQSTYTIQIGLSSSNTSYSSILEGISYSKYPAEDFLNKFTDYTFGFNINSSLCNLVKYKLELSFNNATILNSVEGTNACGSNISLVQNTYDYNIIYARYYVDIGAGYYDISPSAYPIANVTAGEGSIWKAFTDMMSYSSGSVTDNYGRLWWTFFLVFVFLSAFTYFTGAELQNPGIMLLIVLLGVLFLSMMGFFTMNFTGSPGHPQNTWVNQYALFFLSFCFAIGYLARRMSE